MSTKEKVQAKKVIKSIKNRREKRNRSVVKRKRIIDHYPQILNINLNIRSILIINITNQKNSYNPRLLRVLCFCCFLGEFALEEFALVLFLRIVLLVAA